MADEGRPTRASISDALRVLSRISRAIAVETARYAAALERCPDMTPWELVRNRAASGDPTASTAVIAARARDESAARLAELRRVAEAGYELMHEMAVDGVDPDVTRAYEALYLDGNTVYETERRLGVSRTTVYRLRDSLFRWLAAHPASLATIVARNTAARL